MRVVAGSARGRKLLVPQGDGTRPTAGVVKEAMFNILLNLLQGAIAGAKVLDLFAGTGQLGIEALSRGAGFCTFVEVNKAAAEIVCANLKNAGFAEQSVVRVTRVENFLQSGISNRFDVAILDPPYGEVNLSNILPYVFALMEENGIVVCETDKKENLNREFGKYQLTKEYFYGRKKLTLFKCGKVCR
ncbi:MAG: 16S rRNA (guanine(966)-N(2))-methyltransferase RsmD [Oscillospiraceae bacterium]|jgi:16S rRNA (guanine(966)-N(2))-methyltransferase RsmD|nr:16S rRNA (guanine(966)-N(2))-methyltransferase RsmD [Oscillospiraceae bacterium]